MTDRSTQERLNWLNDKCLRALSILSLALMISLIVLGLLTIALSIYPLFYSTAQSFLFEFKNPGSVPNQVSPNVAFALGVALDGLEFVFLAPLAFLLLHGIWNFVNDVILKKFKDPKEFPASPLFLIRIKGLIIGLMIAVVATELLKKTVGDRLRYEHAIAGALVVIVLTAYSFIMERSSAARADKSGGIAEPPPAHID